MHLVFTNFYVASVMKFYGVFLIFCLFLFNVAFLMGSYFGTEI